MKIIKLHHPIDPKRKFTGPVVLALGFFDGLHLGHQKVIATARKIAQARHFPLAVLTYDHHPATIYRRLDRHDRRYLTLYHDKMRDFRQLGVQIVYLVNYTASFQFQSPQQFVDNYLVRLKAQTVVAGFNHTYGDSRVANMRTLPRYARGRMRVVTVPKVEVAGQKVSSTKIKRALDRGAIEAANQMLGRPFQTSGTVVRGYQRGRKLGFPTLNIATDDYQWLPGEGVYVTRVKINHRFYPGMASIGRNATFGNHYPITVEINLLNFSRNVYGEVVRVDWLKKLRNQVKFANAQALIQQMKNDRAATQKYFQKL